MWMLSGSIFLCKGSELRLLRGKTLNVSSFSPVQSSPVLDSSLNPECWTLSTRSKVNRLTKMIFCCSMGPGNYN